MYYIRLSKKEKEIILRRGLFLAGLEFTLENGLQAISERLSVVQNIFKCPQNLCYIIRNELFHKWKTQFIRMKNSRPSSAIYFIVALVEVLWSNFSFRSYAKNSECWKLFLKRCHIESFYEFTNKNKSAIE